MHTHIYICVYMHMCNYIMHSPPATTQPIYMIFGKYTRAGYVQTSFRQDLMVVKFGDFSMMVAIGSWGRLLFSENQQRIDI